MLTGTGDLGQRLAEQRQRRGMSQAETADRADVAVSYLEYLETSATADPGPDVLIRLADALGTTAAALRGGGLSLPPGQRRAAGHPVLAELTPARCRELLAPGGVGRFLFVTDRGPVAVPVNYGLLGGDIVFRTSESGRVAAATRSGSVVSFSVDRIDDALAEGWSVLASGAAAVIPDPAGRAVAQRLGIEPWAGGARDLVIRLTPREITGRRIRAVR
jgi:nitroimidazol reductase NimA-like FMN-containing flavoprotein (pyridoxamine 5'-phosphate oxidase superfamily)